VSPAAEPIHAWAMGLAERLAARDRAGALPPVSSELSSQLGAQLGVASPSPQDYHRAISALVGAYAPIFARLFAPQVRARPRDGGLKVLSLCTGYDAGVELLALGEAFGPLATYASIERDEQAVACNREQLDPLPPGLDRAIFVAGDLRAEAVVGSLIEREGPFDFGLALRPPVTATAYADERRLGSRAWLSERIDPPVVLDLLALAERGVLPPIGIVMFTQTEVSHLCPMLAALGYAELAARVQTVEHGLDQPPWHTLVLP
jgi:hypothetical protein